MWKPTRTSIRILDLCAGRRKEDGKRARMERVELYKARRIYKGLQGRGLGSV